MKVMLSCYLYASWLEGSGRRWLGLWGRYSMSISEYNGAI